MTFDVHGCNMTAINKITVEGINNDIELRLNNIAMSGLRSAENVNGLTGLKLGTGTSSSCRIELSISNSYFVGYNKAIELSFYGTESSRSEFWIVISESIFEGQHVVMDVIMPTFMKAHCDIFISDSKFRKSKQVLQFRRKYPRTLPLVRVHPMTFSSSSVVLRDVEIIENHSSPSTGSGVIQVINAKRIILSDSKFVNNTGTAVLAYSSNIILAGKTIFYNNSGIRGGAIALYQSYIYPNLQSEVVFIGNYANDVGGAIFVENVASDNLCFFQITSVCVKNTANLTFEKNVAITAGDDIYGGAVYGVCNIFTENIDEKHHIAGFSIFHKDETGLSAVSSDPKRVCLCNDQGTSLCAIIDYIYRELPRRYPGEVFTVPASVVGYDFGTVPGVVYSKLLDDGGNTTIKENQFVQEVNTRECKQLTFSIQTLSTNSKHTILLNTNRNTKITDSQIRLNAMNDDELLRSIERFRLYKTITSNLLNHIVLITVLLENCPTGFNLTTTPPYICSCHPKLVDHGITVCIITNHTGWVYRSGTVWVSDSFAGNETSSFIVHQYCPYDYCKPENVSVDLKLPDSQCSFNRSGILCGSCHGNLSLALGTSRCLHCDNNNYLTLFLVFILAGPVLVLFIKILDFTVAKGTINGLVFYAKIVWASKSIIFPTAETLHPVQQILHTFIAWLNLDLGIETCFINGLSSYWKTWLQCVFPLYIWLITGVVIVLSHYSTRASKIFGNNSVQVLATLVLLFYTKLLRTIITSLGFSLLNYPEGTKVVWSFDGNVPYFGVAHTIIFLVALTLLLLLWLPYTTVLLTLQWLRRKSYLKPLRWINRWKPFFDAYFGQLKPKHYYWIGLLLLVRVVLLVVIAATSAVVPRINILAIVVVGVCLLILMATAGSVYKSRSLSIIEGSFIANLTGLGVAKLYIQTNGEASKLVSYSSIGVAFVQFLAIVIYHIWLRLKSTYLTYKRRHREGENTLTDRELRVIAAVPHTPMHYREPLLDSIVQEK